MCDGGTLDMPRQYEYGPRLGYGDFPHPKIVEYKPFRLEIRAKEGGRFKTLAEAVQAGRKLDHTCWRVKNLETRRVDYWCPDSNAHE